MCEWKQTDDESSVWESACGHAFYFDDASLPAENGFKFCPFCGRKLTPVAADALRCPECEAPGFDKIVCEFCGYPHQ